MKSICYIILIIGIPVLLLAGCAEPRIAKTNCWSSATSNTTVSTKGSSHFLAPESDAAACR